jgi:hypothetical protein
MSEELAKFGLHIREESRKLEESYYILEDLLEPIV